MKTEPPSAARDPQHATILIWSTFPDEGVADSILHELLERHLVACVQTLPIQSAYRWQGAIERSSEILALIKTQMAHYPAVEEWIRARHPYTTPEIICVPIAAGLPAYLQWVLSETTSPA